MQLVKSSFFRIVSPFQPLWSFKKLLQQAHQKRVAILMHSVGDESPDHLRYLYRIASLKQFQSNLDWLTKYYRPADLTDWIKPDGQAKMLLSFDDGLREVHDLALPILRAKGIPAVCFVVPDFIDNRQLFYRHKQSILLAALDGRKMKRTEQMGYLQLIRMGNWHAQDTLDEAARLLEVDFEEYLNKQRPYLSLDQMKTLGNNGFTIGAHSMNHPDYREITAEERIRQTTDSLHFIRTHLNQNADCFAFPFTDDDIPDAFHTEIRKSFPHLQSFACAGLKKSSIVQHEQRIDLEQWSRDAAQTLPMEYLYARFRSLFGK